MPFDISCPSCGEIVSVADEHRGWTVRCPVCNSSFQAGDAPAPPPPRPIGDRPWARQPPVDEPLPYQEPARGEPLRFREPSRGEILRTVSGPATALAVVGWIGLVFCAIMLIVFVFFLVMLAQGGNLPNQQKADLIAQMVQSGIQVGVHSVVSILIIVGARKMSRLESHAWAMTSAILALLPCVNPCCLLGLPFGIWALTVISKPEVRQQFDRSGRTGRQDDGLEPW